MQNELSKPLELSGIRIKRIFFESFLSHISVMLRKIFFIFEMWPLLSVGNLHCKFGAIRIRHHGATYAWKLQLCCFCQYTHSVYVHPIFLGRTTHYHVSWLVNFITEKWTLQIQSQYLPSKPLWNKWLVAFLDKQVNAFINILEWWNYKIK